MDATLTGLLLADSRITTTTLTPAPGQAQYEAISAALHVPRFDVVGLAYGIDLFVDDEGAINGSPLNLAATVLAHALGVPTVLSGPALALATDQHGDTITLSPSQTRTVSNALAVPAPTVLEQVAHTLGTAGIRIHY